MAETSADDRNFALPLLVSRHFVSSSRGRGPFSALAFERRGGRLKEPPPTSNEGGFPSPRGDTLTGLVGRFPEH